MKKTRFSVYSFSDETWYRPEEITNTLDLTGYCPMCEEYEKTFDTLEDAKAYIPVNGEYVDIYSIGYMLITSGYMIAQEQWDVDENGEEELIDTDCFPFMSYFPKRFTVFGREYEKCFGDVWRSEEEEED